MTKIQILSNTNYQLDKVVKNEIIEAEEIKIAVAFLRKTGLDLVKKQLSIALSNKTNIEFIVGLDFKTTDYKALLELEKIKSKHDTFKYYCFGDKKENYNSLIFHPKIYLFNTDEKYVSIVGSSNFTGGGLTTNFEVNTIFQETSKNFKYFQQTQNIYDEIKFQDSVFIPNQKYINEYVGTRSKIDKNSIDVLESNEIQEEIKELKEKSSQLEGALPSLKKIIVNFMKNNPNRVYEIKEIYIYCEKYIKKEKLENRYQSKDFRATIRGELNKHELLSKHKDNMKLFERVEKGRYLLSREGVKYDKR